MFESKILSVIIIDDSIESINNLKKIIEVFFKNELSIIKTYQSAIEAIEDIGNYNPDILFLDVEMPHFNGFEVKDMLPEDFNAKIVIVSGKQQYVVKSIGLNVDDYLTKPILLSEFRNCINKIKQEIFLEQKSNQLNTEVISVTGHNKTHFFDYNKISRIQANGAYSIVYYEGKQVSVTKHLKYFEDILPTSLFSRIHRSTIINFNYVLQVNKNEKTSDILMKDGSVIEITNTKNI